MADEEVVEVPVDYKLPAQTMWLNIDLKKFFLRLYWNTRNERWYLSVLKSPSDPVKMGAPLLPGWVPFRQFASDPDLPSGDFVVVDSSTLNIPPGRYDLGPGRRVSLVYHGPIIS